MCVCVCVCVLVAQLCLTLCNPKDYIQPGSSVCEILQARILEWVAISFSKPTAIILKKNLRDALDGSKSWEGKHCHSVRDFPGGADGKVSATMRETQAQSLGWEEPLEKEMATHSSTIAWKIPWTEETGRLQSTGWQRVGHDWTLESCVSCLLPLVPFYFPASVK